MYQHVAKMSSARRFHTLWFAIGRKGNTAVRAYTYLYHTSRGLAGTTEIHDTVAPSSL
jgi:hypothetical protein